MNTYEVIRTEDDIRRAEHTSRKMARAIRRERNLTRGK